MFKRKDFLSAHSKNTTQNITRQRCFRKHDFSVPRKLKKRMARFFVATHVGFEKDVERRHPSLFGKTIKHEALVQRISVPRHHIWPACVSSSKAIEKVTHRSYHVRLDF